MLVYETEKQQEAAMLVYSHGHQGHTGAHSYHHSSHT